MSNASQNLWMGCHYTKVASFFLTVLSEPANALYTLLPFIFIRDLHATSWQLAIFISLRPLLSVFSAFWTSFHNQETRGLLKNVKLACCFAYTPFILFAFCNNIWLILLASACFQLFHRAGIPAWMEIVQRKLPSQSHGKLFSLSFAIGFLISGSFGLLIGFLLDKNADYFRYLLCITAALGLSSILFLNNVPTQLSPEHSEKDKEPILKPIQNSLKLLYERKDFRHFQWVFMIGGSALMLMAPSLSIYYVNMLLLSHMDISIARFVWMAMGVICSSYLWKKSFQIRHINTLLSPVLLGFALFPLVLLLAQIKLGFLYLAFFIYGISQAGSHLIWNLSPLTFSFKKNSIPFSQTNLLLIGFRGLIFPFLGSILYRFMETGWVLFLGSILCIIGSIYALLINPMPYECKDDQIVL